MIHRIRIQDFAIIDNLEIEFHEGFNILTGETGAGKSIIIEAISLALGSRADTTFVRTGREKAMIQLVAEQNGEEYLITREIQASGKSTCRVNDEIVTVTQLNKLCKSIADIHGQYDHQSLLQVENHQQLIDSFQKDLISPIKDQVSVWFHEYSHTKQQLHLLQKNYAEGERKKDFMRFELQEINAAQLMLGEDLQLAQTLLLQQHGEMIYQSLTRSYELLRDQEQSCLDLLGRTMHHLGDIAAYSPEIEMMQSAVSDVYYKLEDLAIEIRKYKESVNYSQTLLDDTAARIDLIEGLKRKYGGTIEKILAYAENIEKEIQMLENIDEETKRLLLEIAHLEHLLSESSQLLRQARKETAFLMEQAINLELAELNFHDAIFTTDFQPVLDNSGNVAFKEDGIDSIEFLISANKGEVPKPLAKIASGGEMSRIMLAFKRIIGNYDRIPTMIFDEIDSGISGITASIVARKLAQISKNHQVICITHLPQIAATGDHHYKIDKIVRDGKTYTTVEPLRQAEQILEIARLLGGIHVTESTLVNARELIQKSKAMISD